MQTVTLRSHVGEDGVLRLDVPLEVVNTDLEVTVVVQPIAPSPSTEAHEAPSTVWTNAWENLDHARQRHAGQVFSDSVELLREGRQR
jgi:hypothetical protein